MDAPRGKHIKTNYTLDRRLLQQVLRMRLSGALIDAMFPALHPSDIEPLVRGLALQHRQTSFTISSTGDTTYENGRLSTRLGSSVDSIRFGQNVERFSRTPDPHTHTLFTVFAPFLLINGHDSVCFVSKLR